MAELKLREFSLDLQSVLIWLISAKLERHFVSASMVFVSSHKEVDVVMSLGYGEMTSNVLSVSRWKYRLSISFPE